MNQLKDKNVSKVLSNLLKFQNQLKLYHWQTKSYARHKAADKFVEKAQDITDRIVESFQGAYETRIKLNDNSGTFKLENLDDDSIIVYLEQMRNFINTDFSNILDEKKDHDLYALRDEMLENIDVTFYLFDLE